MAVALAAEISLTDLPAWAGSAVFGALVFLLLRAIKRADDDRIDAERATAALRAEVRAEIAKLREEYQAFAVAMPDRLRDAKHDAIRATTLEIARHSERLGALEVSHATLRERVDALREKKP